MAPSGQIHSYFPVPWGRQTDLNKVEWFREHHKIAFTLFLNKDYLRTHRKAPLKSTSNWCDVRFFSLLTRLTIISTIASIALACGTVVVWCYRNPRSANAVILTTDRGKRRMHSGIIVFEFGLLLKWISHSFVSTCRIHSNQRDEDSCVNHRKNNRKGKSNKMRMSAPRRQGSADSATS